MDWRVTVITLDDFHFERETIKYFLGVNLQFVLESLSKEDFANIVSIQVDNYDA